MSDNEQSMRDWIDNASYEHLLSKWRSAPAGDPFFRKPLGDYYSEVMAQKKAEVGHSAAVAASKRIG